MRQEGSWAARGASFTQKHCDFLKKYNMDGENLDLQAGSPRQSWKQEALRGGQSCQEEKWKQTWAVEGTAVMKDICRNVWKQPVQLRISCRLKNRVAFWNVNFVVSLSVVFSMWIWLSSKNINTMKMKSCL